jgi:drug/metabolite transporter (DMT)-like permease
VFESHWGETAALITAVFWTITVMSFESAGKRVGSLAVNLIRLCLGFFFLSIFTWLARGMLFPTDASSSMWFWLSLSGIVGFVLGDLFLFKAFVLIGSRVSMLIMASVPPMTAVLGWIWMGETLTVINIIGMVVTIAGIILVISRRQIPDNHKNFVDKHKGIMLAFAGAFGQALGLVLSKFGMGEYDPFAATQIRSISGIFGFCIIFFLTKSWRKIDMALRNPPAMRRIALGAFFGPFLGVSFSLWAIQYTETGVASTIMASVPVLIIFPSVVIFKEKVSAAEIIGALIAVAGVGVMFI